MNEKKFGLQRFEMKGGADRNNQEWRQWQWQGCCSTLVRSAIAGAALQLCET